jgi:pimeloyl-ACP methyl ester carboxylesterase
MQNVDVSSCYYRINLFNGICIAYIDYTTNSSGKSEAKGTILLLHGFPQTSFQFRHVIPTLSNAGYRVIAPNYRGAGESSKPSDGFTKAVMAADIIALLDILDIDDPVHIIGHDIGGIIAFVLASRWPERVASACFSECLLPGSDTYERQLAEHPVGNYHFSLHCVDNLPEALVSGREKLYIDHFINRRCYRVGAFPPEVIQHYASFYAQPGALRCAFNLYRTLEQDAEDTRQWITEHGKCKVGCMLLNGEHSSYLEHAEEMALELVERTHMASAVVQQAGHFLSEENPHEFSERVLDFVVRSDASSRSVQPVSS